MPQPGNSSELLLLPKKLPAGRDGASIQIHAVDIRVPKREGRYASRF
jgi:hypothetical protein